MFCKRSILDVWKFVKDNLSFVLYWFFTTDERHRYAMGKIKGMNCVSIKDKSLFLYGSTTEYKYERRAPVREYLTYREFMESRKKPPRTKLEVGDVGYDYRDDVLERRIKIIAVKDDQCTYLTYQFDGIRLFEFEMTMSMNALMFLYPVFKKETIE